MGRASEVKTTVQEETAAVEELTVYLDPFLIGSVARLGTNSPVGPTWPSSVGTTVGVNLPTFRCRLVRGGAVRTSFYRPLCNVYFLQAIDSIVAAYRKWWRKEEVSENDCPMLCVDLPSRRRSFRQRPR